MLEHWRMDLSMQGCTVTYPITVVAWTLIPCFFIQSGSSDDRDNRRDSRGGGFGGYGMGNRMLDLFYPRSMFSPYYGYYGRYDP